MQILVFGDSITWGAWDKEGGWVQRLKGYLDNKTLTEAGFEGYVYNLGISGDITADVLKRFEFETKQRVEKGDKVMFIFSIGSNDSEWVNDKNSLNVKPEKFKNDLEKLIKLSKKFSSRIVFVGLIPVDESKVDLIPWAKDRSYKNEFIKKFDSIIKLVCEKNKIQFIDLFNKFISIDYKILLEDGVHPNSKGHELIYEIIKKELKF